MKTLDEVIEAIEVCRDSYVAGKIIKSDALHYLKEYQQYQNTPSRSGHMALVDYFDEQQKNEPLTWDELRGMQGKPVWVEMEGYKPNWGIVMNQDERNGRMSLCGYDKVAIRIEINEEGEGNTWQAYRKERG